MNRSCATFVPVQVDSNYSIPEVHRVKSFYNHKVRCLFALLVLDVKEYQAREIAKLEIIASFHSSRHVLAILNITPERALSITIFILSGGGDFIRYYNAQR